MAVVTLLTDDHVSVGAPAFAEPEHAGRVSRDFTLEHGDVVVVTGTWRRQPLGSHGWVDLAPVLSGRAGPCWVAVPLLRPT